MEKEKEVMGTEALIESYMTLGATGFCVVFLGFLLINLVKKSETQAESLKNLEVENKGQSESINNMEGMIIKLINRWNDSDAVRDRRYEQTMEAISDLEKQLSRMDGIMSRMNGNGRN